MKTLILSIVLLVPLNVSAISYTIDSGATNVGGLDALLDVVKLPNSGEATETAYVASVIGTSDFNTKVSNLTATSTDQDVDVLAADIAPGDDYFLLKNETAWALFDNTALVDWAVFDTTASVIQRTLDEDMIETNATTGTFSELFNLSSSKLAISHITLFTGDGVDIEGDPVPAPAAWLLMLPFLGILKRLKNG